MYGLYGKLRAHPGQRDALIEQLLQAAHLLNTLDGCYLYVVNRDPYDMDGVWVTEIWRTQDDYQASLTNDAVKTLIAGARPLIVDMPQRIEVTPVGGKGLPDFAE